MALDLTTREAAFAQDAIPAKECSPLIENRGACWVSVTTYAGKNGASTESPATTVSAQGSSSPPAVRVAAKSKEKASVTIVVHKRPLETVSSQLTCNQAVKPDVLGTIVGKLATPLGGLTLYSTVESIDRGKTPKPPELTQFEEHLADDVANEQDKWLKQINDQSKVLEDVGKEIAAAQKYPPTLSLPDGSWQSTDITKFRDCLRHISMRLGAGSQIGSPNSCETLNSADAKAMRSRAVQALPVIEVAKLTSTVNGLPKELEALQKDLQNKKTPLTKDQLEAVNREIDELTDRQDTLTGNLKTAQTTRATLLSYGQTLDAWNTAWPANPEQLVSQSFPIYCDSSRGGQATGSAKLSTLTLLTKESGDGGTVPVTWIRQPWEVSAGIMYSTVLGRSFQNSNVIKDGVVQVDRSGKPITEVTESTTKPTIDAVILVHYRIYEWPAFQSRRFAILGTGGVGTGTNGSGADFAAGFSLAFGNFFVSPLLHFTRDLRLTNGVTLGQNLMGASPSTERYWVHKFGLAFTYGLPIT